MYSTKRMSKSSDIFDTSLKIFIVYSGRSTRRRRRATSRSSGCSFFGAACLRSGVLFRWRRFSCSLVALTTFERLFVGIFLALFISISVFFQLNPAGGRPRGAGSLVVS